METTTSTLAIYYPTMDFKTRNDINLACESNDKIAEVVSGIIRNYHTINIADAMKNLTQVGQLLQLAYSGTKGFPCSVKVIGILANYQALIKNSYGASTNFVEISISALKYHKMALNFLEKKKIESAMKMIAKTGEIAGRMVEISNSLVDEAKSLCDKSTQALEAATEDESVTNQKKSEVKKLIAEYKSKEAMLRQKTEDLKNAVEEEKEREKKAAQEGQAKQKIAFAISLVSAAVQPFSKIAFSFIKGSAAESVTGGINQILTQPLQQLAENRKKANAELHEVQKNLAVRIKQLSFEKDEERKRAIEVEIVELQADVTSKSESLQEFDVDLKKTRDEMSEQAKMSRDKEARSAEARAEFQKELRQANADLVESVSRLANSTIEENSLDGAIHSLEVAVQTLGRIKTVFENARLFWIGVQNHCKKLSDVECIKILSESGEEDIGDLTDAVKESGFDWLALGKINLTAATSMENVNKTIDNIMLNLPTKSDSIKLVEYLSNSMLVQLKEESSLLQEESSLLTDDNNNNLKTLKS